MSQQSNSGKRRIIVFGEALIDEYPDKQVVAGAPLHVAAHLASRGWQVDFVTRVGKDKAAKKILATLRKYKVGTSFVETDSKYPTGSVTVTTKGQANTFTINQPTAWDFIVGPRQLPHHSVFYYGTLAARSGVSFKALKKILRLSQARTKVLDVNLRPPFQAKDRLKFCLSQATIIKLNKEEMEWLAKNCKLPKDPITYFRHYPSLQFLCVTLGQKGSALYARSGEAVFVKPPRMKVVDTVGAGDAFVAGLIDGLHPDLIQVLTEATAAAAETLGRPGGLPN